MALIVAIVLVIFWLNTSGILNEDDEKVADQAESG